MNWKFWKKKVETPAPTTWKMNINIYFYNTSTITSFSHPCEESSDYKSMYKDFYCWYYFGKTDKYEFAYNRGAYIIKREDIRMIHFYKEKN